MRLSIFRVWLCATYFFFSQNSIYSVFDLVRTRKNQECWMECLIGLLIAFFAIFLLYCVYKFIQRKEEKEKRENEEEYYYSLNLHPDKEFRCTNTNDNTYSINLFHSFRQIAIANLTAEYVFFINYQNIIRCDIRQNNLDSSAAGAMAGAMVAGSTGAIIGASSPVCQNLSIRIITSDVLNPSIEIPLISTPVSRESSQYNFFLKFADNIYTTITAIIHENSYFQPAMNLYPANYNHSNFGPGATSYLNNLNNNNQQINMPVGLPPYSASASNPNQSSYDNPNNPNGPKYPYIGG